MADVIDLDALAPKPVTVKLGDEEIVIQPPSLEAVMTLGVVSQRMQELDPEKLEENSEIVNDLTKQIYKCAPVLEGKNLNIMQLIKLLTIITEMSTPPDIEELKKRGIEPDSPKAE